MGPGAQAEVDALADRLAAHLRHAVFATVGTMQRVAALLAARRASWYQRHMALVTALSKGRYEVMTRAMAAAGVEPVIIEDLVYFGEDRGIAKGLATALLQVITQRGLALTDVQRDRVTSCTDPAALERWVARAVTALRADDVFSDD